LWGQLERICANNESSTSTTYANYELETAKDGLETVLEGFEKW